MQTATLYIQGFGPKLTHYWQNVQKAIKRIWSINLNTANELQHFFFKPGTYQAIFSFLTENKNDQSPG